MYLGKYIIHHSGEKIIWKDSKILTINCLFGDNRGDFFSLYVLVISFQIVCIELITFCFKLSIKFYFKKQITCSPVKKWRVNIKRYLN